MTSPNEDDASISLNRLRAESARLRWLVKIRPQALAQPLYKVLRAQPPRSIVSMDGVPLYVDPFTHHGFEIVSGRIYEAETIAIIRDALQSNSVFLDVGANEGVMSAVAAAHLGTDGLVVAVEPQSALTDYIRINLAMNARCPHLILVNAVTETDGEEVKLSLRPPYHSGGASVVNTYRWGKKKETVRGRSVDSIVAELGRTVDLMKVDVEGYEPEVVRSSLGSLEKHRIHKILVDYHTSTLAKRGMNAGETHKAILERGYSAVHGDPASGYVLYNARRREA
jgi:FkbM family methyltransferase